MELKYKNSGKQILKFQFGNYFGYGAPSGGFNNIPKKNPFDTSMYEQGANKLVMGSKNIGMGTKNNALSMGSKYTGTSVKNPSLSMGSDTFGLGKSGSKSLSSTTQGLIGAGVNVASGIATSAADDKDDTTNTNKEAAATIGGTTLSRSMQGGELMGGNWMGYAGGAVIGAVEGLFRNKKKNKEAGKNLNISQSSAQGRQNSVALNDLMSRQSSLGSGVVPLTGSEAVQTRRGYLG